MKKTLLFIALIASSAFFAQTNLVLNGTCDDFQEVTGDNADAWDMTPNSKVKLDGGGGEESDSPYAAIWKNQTLEDALEAKYFPGIENPSLDEQPGSTSSGKDGTRGVKLYDDGGQGGDFIGGSSRRLYQLVQGLTIGNTYSFSIDSKSNSANTPSEVYILNTEISDEDGIDANKYNDASVVTGMDITTDEGNWVTTTFSFVATTTEVVIYVRALEANSEDNTVYYDNIWLFATEGEGEEGEEGDELVLNGTADEHDESENASSFDMTPDSDVAGGKYKALWDNAVLDTWLETNCGDSDEQPGSTSDGQLNENFEKTRGLKLYEPCRRLYQKIAVTPGVTYNFSVETRAEKGEEDDNNVIEVNNLEVYILNTEIEDENGLTGAVGGVVDYYVNITDHLNNSKPSEENNTFTKTEFSFTATTSTVVIYMRAPLATSSAYDVFIDNVSLKAAAVASVDNVFASKISIYPNPVTNFINISTTENISSLEIYSLIGKRVLSIKNLENNQVDISNLASGMYMLRLTNGISVATKKIIKK